MEADAMRLDEGTVLHVTVCREGVYPSHKDLLEGEPAWAIVTETDDTENGVYVRWLGDREVGITCVGGSDKYSVPPPEKWPDYVAVEVAKYHLLGDNHEER
jgi:hypothetical protein